MTSSSDLSVKSVKGIGPSRARLLEKLGIFTITDAFYYLPLRYEDRSNPKPIGTLAPGSRETIKGSIVSIVAKRSRKQVTEAVLSDGSGYIKAIWFNQPYLRNTFRMGQTLILSGVVKQNNRDLPPVVMHGPDYEIVSNDDKRTVHEGRIVPIYGLTEGISQKQIRNMMFSIISEHLPSLKDPVPDSLLLKYGLPTLSECIPELHFPRSADNLEKLNSRNSGCHIRIKFDELFLFSLGIAVIKSSNAMKRGISFRPNGQFRDLMFRMLPFELTKAQLRVIEEIRADMSAPKPMQRLLQGDVGCGKTLVAVAAMLDAVECGYQAALMAPTEILAEQHYINIHRIIERLGLKIVLLTGHCRLSEADMAASDIVVGTHALIQEGVSFRKLGLVIVDEQHKFGVVQRSMLRKKGPEPDVLVMSATPIPRSLALTLYGELECSVIDELPKNRKPVETKCMNTASKEDVYALLRQELSNGRQAYVVYPAIEESENSDLKDAVNGKTAFQQKFPEYRTGLIHGRMRAEDRETVMEEFKNGQINILVSTTVIEVGLDVPNATVMVIVHAERFGLGQLHQLRGRVGRGSDRACCILIVYDPVSDDARRRLDIMTRTNDGFRIAEEDLQIRGPGDFLGTRQAGLPDMRNADIIRDHELLNAAKIEAADIVDKDPDLVKYSFLKKRLDVFWKGRIELFRTG